MKESLFIILDVCLIISAFVLTFNLLRLLLWLAAKNEADTSRKKSIIVTTLILITTVVMHYSGTVYLGQWYLVGALFFGIVYIKKLCWVNVPKSFVICILVMASGYGSLLGFTKLIIGGTFKRKGKWVALINNVVVGKGTVVSVDYEERSYHWRLDAISEKRILCDPVLPFSEQPFSGSP